MAKVKRLESERDMVDSWDDVPEFETEAEEQAWWDKHELSEALVEQFERVKAFTDLRAQAERNQKILDESGITTDELLESITKVSKKVRKETAKK